MNTPSHPLLRRTLLSVLVAAAASGSAIAQVAEVRGPGEAPVHVVQAPQRFVVKYAAGGDAAPGIARALESTLEAAIARAGLDRAPAAARNATPLRVQHRRAMAADGWHVVTTSRPLDATEAESFLRAARADAGIASIEIDRLYQHMGIEGPTASPPSDPNYAQYQWNFGNPVGGIAPHAAWDLSTGQGVVVAVLDTGITENTLDLQANVIPGYDFISDRRVSRRAEDGRVPGGWDIGSWTEENYCVQLGALPHPARTSSWHGTHVAGTIAQETNNGIGLAGAAPDARVMPVRVLGSCGGFGSDIADAMIWAAGGSVPGVPDNANPAEILNMSLGSSGPAACPAYYQDAIDEVNARGAAIVVAAGNSNADAGTYTMSSCDGVISVGATGIAGGKAGYSSWGAKVDLSAPGGGGQVDGNPSGFVWQVTNGGTQGPVAGNWILRGMSGTSMASPHVAAVAALVQSAVETPLTWSELRDLLVSTVRPFPVAPPAATPIGAGIVDPLAVVEAALDDEGPCDPATDPDCGGGTPIDATPIAAGEVVANLAGGAGAEHLFSIEVPAGTASLNVLTYGGTGDVSLYVSRGTEPSADSHDHRSVRPGTNETVRVANPAAGTYYVKVIGVAPFSRVSLQARR
ncbi:S8 family peptidase [Coralloluteibacterium thermophilus]|uniref:S8 family peptidase n=1 Tax=Coralloluteibacterium thermophilum TaxID=2707049 RepID=A0ABV9NLQ9_9GAMM